MNNVYCTAACDTPNCNRRYTDAVKVRMLGLSIALADFTDHCDDHTIDFPQEIPMENNND